MASSMHVCILIIDLIMVNYAESRVYNIRTDSPNGLCTYSGYIPGGKQVDIPSTRSRVAELEAGILSTELSFADLSSKVIDDDILIGLEVDDRLLDMDKYVSGNFLNEIKNLIKTYRGLVQLWAHCIEEITPEGVIQCQVHAAQLIRSNYANFLYVGNDPTGDEIKKMEVAFLPFRNYITLNILQLQTLADAYSDSSIADAATLRKKVLNQLSIDIAKSIDDVKGIYDKIYEAHSTTAAALCESTKTCEGQCTKEGSWFGYTACYGSCKCSFDPTMPDCKRRCTVRADGKKKYKSVNLPVNLGYNMVGEYFSWNNLLKPSHSKFLEALKKDVENYWQSAIMNLIPTWTRIKENADSELAKSLIITNTSVYNGSLSDRFVQLRDNRRTLEPFVQY